MKLHMETIIVWSLELFHQKIQYVCVCIACVAMYESETTRVFFLAESRCIDKVKWGGQDSFLDTPRLVRVGGDIGVVLFRAAFSLCVANTNYLVGTGVIMGAKYHLAWRPCLG